MTQARSRQEIEDRMCAMWAGLLGTAVGPEDDFFDIGGDSLLVVDVLIEARRLGLELKSADVFKHRTAARLAEILTAPAAVPADARPLPALRVPADEIWSTHASTWSATAPGCLVPLVAEGRGAPLFVVHWGNDAGYVWNAVRGWGGGRPVYGFEGPGYRGEIRPVVTIHDMAERYLVDLLRQQPRGPYFLAGLCHGAVVAFEMARALRARGEEVPLLAMVKPATLERFVSYGWGLDEILQYRIESLCARFGFAGDEDLDEVYRRLRADGWYDDQLKPADLPRLQMMWAALVLSLHHYEPRPYDGRVVMFQDTVDADQTERNWGPALAEVESHWFDYGVDSPRPILSDARVAEVIRRELAR
jgi:thioesterase domain-containing protein